jgi:outer membrane lipoprotein carrier protein
LTHYKFKATPLLLPWNRILLLVVSLNLLMSTSAAADPVEKLTQALANVPDFSAAFSQLTSDSKGRRLQAAQGQLWISKPYSFRWHTEPPMEQVLVADGELLWLYDPDLEQVTIQKMEPALTSLPVLILTGNVTRLSQEFAIDHYEDEDGDHFSFRPKADVESFKLVLIHVNSDQIKRIDITDTLNQKTAIELTNFQTEESYPDGMFQFQIPDGTDVIRDF